MFLAVSFLCLLCISVWGQRCLRSGDSGRVKEQLSVMSPSKHPFPEEQAYGTADFTSLLLSVSWGLAVLRDTEQQRQLQEPPREFKSSSGKCVFKDKEKEFNWGGNGWDGASVRPVQDFWAVATAVCNQVLRLAKHSPSGKPKGRDHPNPVWEVTSWAGSKFPCLSSFSTVGLLVSPLLSPSCPYHMFFSLYPESFSSNFEMQHK